MIKKFQALKALRTTILVVLHRREDISRASKVDILKLNQIIANIFPRPRLVVKLALDERETILSNASKFIHSFCPLAAF